MNCGVCKKDFPESCFPKDSSKRLGVRHLCKLCFNARKKAKRDENKKKAIKLLGGKCQICMESYRPCCYDFHHHDPDGKESNPSDNAANSWKRFWGEAKKCVLLCKNCHAIEHEMWKEGHSLLVGYESS